MIKIGDGLIDLFRLYYQYKHEYFGIICDIFHFSFFFSSCLLVWKK